MCLGVSRILNPTWYARKNTAFEIANNVHPVPYMRKINNSIPHPRKMVLADHENIELKQHPWEQYSTLLYVQKNVLPESKCLM